MRSVLTHSFASSDWNSDSSVGYIFRILTANMMFLDCIDSNDGDINDDDSNLEAQWFDAEWEVRLSNANLK